MVAFPHEKYKGNISIGLSLLIGSRKLFEHDCLLNSDRDARDTNPPWIRYGYQNDFGQQHRSMKKSKRKPKKQQGFNIGSWFTRTNSSFFTVPTD